MEIQPYWIRVTEGVGDVGKGREEGAGKESERKGGMESSDKQPHST